MKIKIDQDALTLGDLEDFEELTGHDLMKVMQEKVVRDENGKPVPDPDDEKGRPLTEIQMTAKDLTALLFIVLRNETPDITMDEVRKIKVTDIEYDVPDEDKGDAELDPTGADDSGE